VTDCFVYKYADIRVKIQFPRQAFLTVGTRLNALPGIEHEVGYRLPITG